MSGPPTASPPAALPVEILRESWNEYRLEDGTVIRARPIIMKIVFPDGRPSPGQSAAMNLGAVPIIVTFVPPERRGPKAKANPTQSEIQQARNTPVHADVSQETWNYYRVPGLPGGLKVKLTVATVTRAEGLFNVEGEQVYSVGWTITGGQVSEEQLQSDLRA